MNLCKLSCSEWWMTLSAFALSAGRVAALCSRAACFMSTAPSGADNRKRLIFCLTSDVCICKGSAAASGPHLSHWCRHLVTKVPRMLPAKIKSKQQTFARNAPKCLDLTWRSKSNMMVCSTLLPELLRIISRVWWKILRNQTCYCGLISAITEYIRGEKASTSNVQRLFVELFLSACFWSLLFLFSFLKQ